MFPLVLMRLLSTPLSLDLTITFLVTCLNNPEPYILRIVVRLPGL